MQTATLIVHILLQVNLGKVQRNQCCSKSWSQNENAGRAHNDLVEYIGETYDLFSGTTILGRCCENRLLFQLLSV
jgi:hypothetical protein